MGVAVVTTTLNTGTGTQDITSSGFGTPDAAIIFASQDAANADDLLLSLGITDGVEEAVSAMIAEHGSASSNTAHYDQLDALLAFSKSDFSNGVAPNIKASFNAWITDGIRLDVDIRDDTDAVRLVVILINEIDSEEIVKIGDTWDVSDQFHVTDVGFLSDLVFVAGVLGSIQSDGFMAGHGGVAFSAANNDHAGPDNIVEMGAGIGSVNNQASASTAVYREASGLVATVYSNASVAYGFNLTEWDSAGFLATASQSPFSNTYANHALCLAGASLESHIQEITPPASTGTQAYTGVGFQPDAIIIIGTSETSDGLTQAGSGLGAFALGAFDGSVMAGVHACDDDGADPMDCSSGRDASGFKLTDQAGATTTAIDQTSSTLDSDGYTLNYTATDTGDRLFVVAIKTAAPQAIFDADLNTSADLASEIAVGAVFGSDLDTSADLAAELTVPKNFTASLNASHDLAAEIQAGAVFTTDLSVSHDLQSGLAADVRGVCGATSASYIRFNIGGTDYAFGTDTAYRDSIWHKGLIDRFPNFRQSFPSSDFGIIRNVGMEINIADPDMDYVSLLDSLPGVTATLENEVTVEYIRGATDTYTLTRKMLIQSAHVVQGGLRLVLQDLDDNKLDALYPPNTYELTEFSELFEDDVGSIQPEVVGTGIKVPFVLAETNSGSGPFVFYGPRLHLNGNQDVDVATVYRDGRIVTSTEYRQTDKGTLVAGAGELVSNGTFTTDLTGWTVESGSITQSGGECVIDGIAAMNQDGIVTARDTLYRASIEITAQETVGQDELTVEVSQDGGSTYVSMNIGDGGIGTYEVTFRTSDDSSGELTKLRISKSDADSVTIDNVSIKEISVAYRALEFDKEQVGFGNERHRITGDITSDDTVLSNHPIDELQRLIERMGGTVNTSSFATAKSALPNYEIDWVYKQQSTYRSIIGAYLNLCRASLSLDSNGEYVMFQDRITPVTAIVDESTGGLGEALEYNRTLPPTQVSVRYRPSLQNPRDFQHTLTKTVSGGAQGNARPVDLPFVRDHETAQRHVQYLQKRAENNAFLRGSALLRDLDIGDAFVMNSPLWGDSAKYWKVWQVDIVGGETLLVAREHNTDMFTYVAESNPAGATTGYKPDYSKTPPAAPTGLAVVGSSAIAVDENGLATAYTEFKATADNLDNHKIMRFMAVNDTTNEIYISDHDPNSTVGDDEFHTVIEGMRPNEAHTVYAWSINQWGVEGDTASISHTPAAYTSAPSNVGSITADQRGKTNHITWSEVTSSDWRPNQILYRLQRSVDDGAWSEVYRGVSTEFTDEDIDYGKKYEYRVKAEDPAGNPSGTWTESADVNAVADFESADYKNESVDTAARQQVNNMTTSQAGNAGESHSVVFSHSEGKVPTSTSQARGGVGNNDDVVGGVAQNKENSTTVNLYFNATTTAAVELDYW